MNTLVFDFSVDKGTQTIKVNREFAAALSLVWDAFTKSEILDQWWAPKPWKARTKIMNFCEGGQWQYAMLGPEGEEHWTVAHFQTIDQQHKFSLTDAFTDAAGNVNPDLPRTHWELTFTDKGETTLVEMLISCDDVAQLEALLQMGFKEGFTQALAGLDELLAA